MKRLVLSLFISQTSELQWRLTELVVECNWLDIETTSYEDLDVRLLKDTARLLTSFFWSGFPFVSFVEELSWAFWLGGNSSKLHASPHGLSMRLSSVSLKCVLVIHRISLKLIFVVCGCRSRAVGVRGAAETVCLSNIEALTSNLIEKVLWGCNSSLIYSSYHI